MTREAIERREMFPKDGSNATRTGSPGMPFGQGGSDVKDHGKLHWDDNSSWARGWWDKYAAQEHHPQIWNKCL